MAKQGQITRKRKRLLKLANQCGFDCFVEDEKGYRGLAEMLNITPDKDLAEFEDALKDLQWLQEAMRSPN